MDADNTGAIEIEELGQAFKYLNEQAAQLQRGTIMDSKMTFT